MAIPPQPQGVCGFFAENFMSNVDIGLIVSLVGVVIAAITAMVAMFKKLKNKFGELAKDGNWKKLYPMILKAIVKAEATGKSGAEKKEIVMAAVDSFAKELGIQCEADQISDAIEFIIDFSKKVNKKK